MAKKSKKSKRKPAKIDLAYLLKLAFYLIIGSLWVKITHGNNLRVPIPIGFIVGLAFSSHEHFQLDRKIEYAVLLVALLVGFWAPFGLYVSF